MFGKLPVNNLIQYPNGQWGFVGSVSAHLAYVTKDGKVPTQEQFEAAKHCGPGIAGLKTRAWDTKEEAIECAKELRLESTLP